MKREGSKKAKLQMNHNIYVSNVNKVQCIDDETKVGEQISWKLQATLVELLGWVVPLIIIFLKIRVSVGKWWC